MTQKRVVDDFHELFYRHHKQTWANTRWLGVPVLKNPLDLWIYQEIIYETQPDVIIECGTFKGGSALFLATVCDQLGKGRIITLDIDGCKIPIHPRIERIIGNTVDPQIFNAVKSQIKKDEKAMVLLDSDHSTEHVFRELKLYAPLVSLGCYIIVEDTNISSWTKSNPMLAIEKFFQLGASNEFVVDFDCEKFYLTFNPGGYLRRAFNKPPTFI